MLVSRSRNSATLLLTVATASLVGCNEAAYESHFVYSEGTEALIDEAKEGVTVRVAQQFGTPQQLKAWTKLPIDFGGVVGTVSAAPEPDVAVKELTLTLDGDFELAEGASCELQIVNGEAAKEVVVVEGWSAETGVASLTSQLEKIPAVGDTVVIDGGGTLKHGRGLYMRHCSHCHGTSGDGNGPTAEYLWPKPRDYRHGVFKFTSTDAQSKASRDDLHRVLKNGIPGTYMPSFVPMLNDEELEAVIEYVRFLAMRGEFERSIVVELASGFSKDAYDVRREQGDSRDEILAELKDEVLVANGSLDEELQYSVDAMVSSWTAADAGDVVIVPDVERVEDSLESRQKGRELYLSKAINCADCHGIAALGNGPQTTIFEKVPGTETLYPEQGLHDVWDNVNQPRNLTQGIYRGGRRPIDLFRRIQAGIKGSRMPSFKNVKHEDIWHIVNYVLSIPFEPEPGRGPEIEAPAVPAATASR